MQRMHTCCIWAFGVFVMLIFTPQSRVVFCVLPPLCLIVSCLEMANDLRGGGVACGGLSNIRGQKPSGYSPVTIEIEGFRGQSFF